MANSCGLPAVGIDKEAHFCNVDVPCHGSRDCLFTAWGEWNACSASCTGVSMRTREIARPGHGDGLFCEGALKELQPCNPGEGADPPVGCVTGPPVDCVLSDWDSWKDCSATCGGGEMSRARSILQEPSHGGFGCQSHLSELQECGRRSCGGPAALDCVFGEWKEWGECGRCNGERKRFRDILVYPASGGLECAPADLEEVGECPHSCDTEQFCSWADWAAWGRCTATCGTGGERKRIRGLKMLTKAIANHRAQQEYFATGEDDLLQRYNVLYSRSQDLEASHVSEVVVAFSAGSFSLLVLGLLVMRLSGRRTAGDASEIMAPPTPTSDVEALLVQPNL